ncbi:hypothetical protein AX16_006576 [Volvariella volvacea WC 439]|nr:hypothetical protein AX16_006576 [Volvariella volvacea WC 439]
MFTAQLPYTPESSPPSSPAYLDSSPPSSPGSTFSSLPAEQCLADPFAGSAKPIRGPPQYEKKRPAVERDIFDDPETPAKRARYTNLSIRNLIINVPDSLKFLPTLPEPSPSLTPEEREAAIWDEASTRVIDGVYGTVELDNTNLTYIPQRFIADLEKFYVPPVDFEPVTPEKQGDRPSAPPTKGGGRLFTRVVTAPVGAGNLFSRSPENGRTQTFGGLPREDIRLFLSGNQIAELPIELMNLQKLTVLSLRSNYLTRIPPEIGNLKHLHTLNVANNKLSYLPAEILSLSLRSLQVHPNPFLHPPSLPAPGFNPISPTTRYLPRILPLTELCLRMLFSPVRKPPPSSLTTPVKSRPMEMHERCLLRARYELPLREEDDPSSPPLRNKRRLKQPIPIHLKQLLEACVPGSVYLDDFMSLDPPEDLTEWERINSIGTCRIEGYMANFLGPEEGHQVKEEDEGEKGEHENGDEEVRQDEEDEEVELQLGAVQFVEFREGGFGEEDFEDGE